MLELIITPQALLYAGLIFFLRVSDMSLDTMRVMMIMRGKKGAAWILGFFQASIFVLAITSVLRDLNNLINILAYAAGFATGIVVGMWIEERLAIGHTQIRIVSPNLGSAIAEKVRAEGYAITEISARGKDGMVTLLTCSVLRKNVGNVQKIVTDIDPKAFIAVEDVRPVWRGFWRA